MKFKKVLKKIALYLGLFVGVLTLTAGLKVGIFFINKPASVGSSDSSLKEDTSENESISKVLDNMLSSSNSNFDLNLQLTSDSTGAVDVTSNVFLSLPSQTSTLALEDEETSQDQTLKVSLNGEIKFNNQTIEYDVNYLNGVIYIKFGDAMFKVETLNMGEDLNKLLNFAMLKKFGINLNLPDLSGLSLDPSMLASLASQLTETDFENSKEIKFNILGFGWITMTTDFDYILQNLKVEDFDINGTKININMDADLQAEPVEVTEPENKEDLTNLTGLTQFLSVADNLLDKGYVSGKISLNALDIPISADYRIEFADFSNIKVYFKMVFAGHDLLLVYQNDTIYVLYEDCKYYFASPFDFTQLTETIEFYATKFGVTIPEGSFDSLKEIVDINDLNKMLNLFSNLQVDGNGLVFNQSGLNINLAVEDEQFNTLSMSYKDLLTLNFTLDEDINFTQINPSEFKNILEEDLFNNFHQQLIVNKNLAVKVNIKVDDLEFDISLFADFVNDIKAQLKVNILNREIVLNFVNNTVYLEIENILRAKGTIDDILDFLKTSGLLELESQNIDFDSIKDFIFEKLSTAGVVVDLIRQDGNAKAFEITKDNIYCELFTIDFEDISYQESGEYQNLVDFGLVAKNLVDALNSNPLAFNLDISFGEYKIAGKLQYINSKLSAVLSTKILDKDIQIILKDDLIYITIDGLKIVCGLEDLKEIISYASQTLNLELDDMVDMFEMDVDTILNNIIVSCSNKNLNVTYDDISLAIDTEKLSVNIQKGELSGEITFGKQFDVELESGYHNFAQLKNLFKAVIKTLKNASISGEIDVALNMFGEENNLKIDYAVSYQQNKLMGYINTTFKGLDINAYIDNKDVYIDVVGLKIHINIDQISSILEWISETFNVSVDFDVDAMISKLGQTHLDIIKSISTTDTTATIDLNNNLSIIITFDEYISQVVFSQDNKNATLTCTDFEPISFDSLNKKEFKEFDDFKLIIKNAYDLVMTKQYDFVANAEKYIDDSLSNSYTASLQLDVTSSLNAYFDLIGVGEEITASYENKVLYFCYGGENGLKVSIQENAIQEILGIVFNVLNIDTSSISFLDDFLQMEDLDTGNLGNIMPEIDFGNPLQYLEYIEAFDITDSYFAVTLKAEKLGEFAHGKDVSIKINYAQNSITSIEVNNLYITQNANEYINITIDINTFSSVTKVSEVEKYIDFSNAKDLIRAFVNTSNLTDWHIAGKVQLDVSLGNLSISAAKLDVDIQVKLVDAKPIIAVEISSYPLIGLVNNSNTNGVGMVGFAERYRTISIYYKNGEMFLKTSDAKYGAYKQLVRTTKITPSYLVKNLSYYTQYLLGFTDTIQTKIDEAIEKSMSYTGETDYGNIILGYTKEENSHTFNINLTELAHNEDIGTLSLTLTTLNSEVTNNLDYLYRIDLDLNMLDNLIILKTDQKSDSQGLYLTNIGEAVDISKVDEIEKLYEDNGFALDGEYEKEGDKDWEKANTGSSTITFISEGKELKVVEGEIASNITFPTMNNFILEDGVIWQEFEFVGWFYDEQFSMQFTQSTMPRYDTVLYAKWIVVKTKYFATISFETNQESISFDNLTGFIGDSLTLPVCKNFDIKQDENTTILYTFDGWFKENGEAFVSDKFDQASLTLYAHWTTKKTVVFDVKVVNNGQVVLENKYEQGTKLDLSSLDCFNSSTLVYSSQNYEQENLVDDLTINSNITLYLRNKFKVTIKSDITTLNGQPYLTEQEVYEGSTVSLPQYAFFVEDMGSYTIENTFLGYTLNGALITDSTAITPNGDCVFEASWKSVEYCIVTFEIVWSRPSGWVKDGTQNSISEYVSNTNNTNQVKIERNTELVFENYVAEANYEYKVFGIAKDYDFKTVAWAEESENVNAGSYKGASSMTITSNCTLKPIWKGIY